MIKPTHSSFAKALGPAVWFAAGSAAATAGVVLAQTGSGVVVPNVGGAIRDAIDSVHQAIAQTFATSSGVGGMMAILALGAMVVSLIWICFMSRDAVAARQPARKKSGRNAVEHVAPQLEMATEEILEFIRRYALANQMYSATLGKAQVDLDSALTAEQIFVIVKLLVTENQKIQRDAMELSTNLDRSRQQIDDLRLSLATAEETGLRDALTSLSNRRAFDAILSRAVIESHADETPLCLVMGDIDHFKSINDRFGHQAGDHILKTFADIMQNNVKGRDKVARYGGEEFAIILPKTAMGNAYHLTEQIRSQVEQATWFVGKGGQVVDRITASFGIVQIRDNDQPANLVQRADAKLYEAKHSGRNRIVIEGTDQASQPMKKTG